MWCDFSIVRFFSFLLTSKRVWVYAEISGVWSPCSFSPPPPVIDWSQFWIPLIGLPLLWVVFKWQTTVEVHRVGSKDSLLPSQRSLQNCSLLFFSTDGCVICLVFSFSVISGKWAPPCFHNLTTPSFGFKLDLLSSLPLAFFPGLRCLIGFVYYHYNCYYWLLI